MHVRGFTRAGGAVINTETTELELIRQRRAQKQRTDQVQDELGQLRKLVADLAKRVETLERG